MTRLLDGFYRWLLYLASVFTVATLAAILLGVAGREFGFDVPGLDAYAGYFIAASLFLALPSTLRNGDHIRVTLILNRLTGNTRKAADYWCLSAATVLAGYLAYYAVRLAWISWETHDMSSGSDATPLWIPQLSMALGCIGFALAFVEELVLKLLGQEHIIVPSAEMARTE